MKRKFLLLAVLTSTIAIQTNAQVLISLLLGDALNSDKISFGLTGGTHITTISNLDEAKYNAKLNLGFFFDIKLADKFYLHPEVLVKSTMGTRNLLPYATSDPELDTLLQAARVERRINYFNVPILAKYRSAKGWGVEAGPQFSLRTKATDEFKTGVGDKEEILLRKDIRDQITRLDAGLAAGISKKLGKGRAGMTLYGRYYYGFVDIDKLTEGAQVNQAFLINVTIPIGAGKAEAQQETEAPEKE